MAKPSKNNKPNITMNPAMAKFLKGLNDDSVFLSDNSLSIADEFIDTGCYSLNAILTGSLYGGVPTGIITGFVGPSQCGKSLIAAKIVANAQKKGFTAVVWDSEGAWDTNMSNLGVDPDKCQVMPVSTVEETKNQIIKFLTYLKEHKIEDRYIIVLDSLGALSSEKEIEDSKSNKTAADMGTRAKVIKAMSRQIAIKLKGLKIPMIFTNHIYENPAEMYKSFIKNQSGGSGPQYLSTIMVQMSTVLDKVEKKKKDSDDNINDEGEDENNSTGRVKGATVRVLTTKNRLVKVFLEAEMYINFSTGLSRYAGLFDISKKLGIIVGDRTYALSDGTKLGYKKDFINNGQVWEEKIMPLLEPAINKNFKHLAGYDGADQSDDMFGDEIGDESEESEE